MMLIAMIISPWAYPFSGRLLPVDWRDALPRDLDAARGSFLHAYFSAIGRSACDRPTAAPGGYPVLRTSAVACTADAPGGRPRSFLPACFRYSPEHPGPVERTPRSRPSPPFL